MTNHRQTPGTRRILVVANDTVAAHALQEATALGVGDERRTDVRVIAPALNSRLRHWLSDEDAARSSADLRLTASLDSLCAAGFEADGRVGDADPLQAIADALFEFRAEEIVIATRETRRPHWATRDLVKRTRRRFAHAVVHVADGSSDSTKNGSAFRTGRRAGGARRAALVIRSMAPACRRIEANA
jgi:hypothetical protein